MRIRERRMKSYIRLQLRKRKIDAAGVYTGRDRMYFCRRFPGNRACSRPEPGIAREGSSMKIPLYQVDAFASQMFSGNPAAVCLLDRWIDDAILQSIAGEVLASKLDLDGNMKGGSMGLDMF